MGAERGGENIVISVDCKRVGYYYDKCYIITKKDVGHYALKEGEKVVANVHGLLGRVIEHDVGKILVAHKNGLLYIENDEQFNRRKGRKCTNV